MPDCCGSAYAGVFSRRMARRKAKAYRKKGLDGQSARIVSHLSAEPLAGKSVLEVGGGIGAIQIELLKAGAERAFLVELSTEYEEEAAALLAEAGVSERAERRVGDFVEEGATMPVADAVVLNKVICCYPDMPALLGAACEHARERVAVTVPRERIPTRAVMRLANGWFWLRRSAFRTFLHSKEEMIAVARERGFAPAAEHPGFVWEVMLFERVSPGG